MLNQRHIVHEIIAHAPVTTARAAQSLALPYPEAQAVNLFLKDGAKAHYFLVVAHAGTHVDLKCLRTALHSARLSFAKPQELQEVLGLEPGAVTPLGTLADTDHRTDVVIDQSFQHRLIGVHPCTNAATLYLCTDDLVHVLAEHGVHTIFLDMSSKPCT
ncbi:YbaK/EbsC family protein [Bifidobacterium gallicum]|nr:YbaK/EbsC family protein [Bifidobacterium gallicum]